ncbi:tRNA pseudouridine synthase D [Paramyrothecium foliicola]|nr:tRNA pseudouridine synthase D [Paramyrothecium foliicola]
MAEQNGLAARGSGSHVSALGMTNRATPLLRPWTGELRVRFTDFQVNEIAKDGKVVHLRNVGLAEGEQQQNPNPVAEDSSTDAKPEKPAEKAEGAAESQQAPQEEVDFILSPEDAATLEGLAGAQFAQDLVQLLNDSRAPDFDKKRQVISEPLDDKMKRGQIHQEVRRIFNSKLETNTNDSGAIVASILPKRGSKRARGGRGRLDDKPAGEYLHFTLYKDNRDTMDAVNQIARLVRVKPQNINYAGTKDRRASTVQRCSLRYGRHRSLAAINGKLWGISTGDYEYKDESLHLGQLLGNEFTIAIKNCRFLDGSDDGSVLEKLEALKANVQPALDHMAEHGWINYFGHQRFGTHRIGTHEVGKLILGDKFQEAVAALLSFDQDVADKAENGEIPEEPSKRDEAIRHQACMLFMTGKDIAKAARIVPRRFTAEVCILRHLTRQGQQSAKDWIGSIIHITRGLRSMYLHAYQSYIWNHAASRRWELHGSKVVKGDLVIADNDTTTGPAGQQQEQDQDGGDIVNPLDDDDDTPVRARALTEEEALSGRYTINDVVLPSPGYEVIYPDNEIGAFYEEFMGREENGGLSPHKMRRMHREFSLPGRYRKLINRFLATPSVEVKAYADDEEQMHPTDMDLIKASRSNGSGKRARRDSNGEPPIKKARVEGDDDVKPAETSQDDAPPSGETVGPEQAAPVDETVQSAPTKVAVVIKFQLGKSAYATVALRELMGDAPNDATAA